MKQLIEWIHELPDLIDSLGPWRDHTSSTSTRAQDVQFGPAIMSLYVKRMPLEGRPNRVCVVIEAIHVAEEEQQCGWFKRVVTLLAVMSPVDYIYLECVRHKNLLDVLRYHGWETVDHGDSSPDLYRNPKDILGLNRFGWNGV